ncbi:AMP-binding protein [Candidatus Clavichlamydia salmonicola]|uniref:AMP-binding protein n=1 Tax=Candidatus Clavichlamydia salmonicola TaxID=469812 RepID=UPI001891D99E|nr:AMP-binding protein [Candidatus Clavichlamydia salmonicola]
MKQTHMNDSFTNEKESLRPDAFFPEGHSLVESFFLACDRMKHFLLGEDESSGKVSFRKAKIGVLLLADFVRSIPDTHIGIMLPSSVAAQLLSLAIMLAGKIPVQVNWTMGHRDINFLTQLTDTQIVFSSERFLKRREGFKRSLCNFHIIDMESIKKRFSCFQKMKAWWRAFKTPTSIMELFGCSDLRESSQAIILFTSGSESMPKCVPLTHGNILSNLRGCFSVLNTTAKDILLSVLPPFHAFGFSLTGMFPILTGLRVFFYPNPLDIRSLCEIIKENKVSLMALTPTFFRNFLQGGEQALSLSSVEKVFLGGEAVTADIYDRCADILPKLAVLQGYGATECSPVITVVSPNKQQIGAGVPLPGVSLLIVNHETLLPCKEDEQGLILVKGPSVFKGYIFSSTNVVNPFIEINKEKWYSTGDLGQIDSKTGSLILAGRIKRFTKIGGEMISLCSVEAILHEVALERKWTVDSCKTYFVVKDLSIEGKKTRLCLFSTIDISLKEVNHALKEQGVGELVRLSKLEIISEIPLLGIGKINYGALVFSTEG